MIRTRHIRTAAPAVAGDTVTVCLIPWDSPELVTDNGRDFYNESFARGGLAVPERLLGEVEHDGQLVGRAIAVDDRVDGLYADVRISQSTAGRDFLADVDAGIYEAVSIDFDADPAPVAAGGAVTRSGAQLRRFAFTTDPQHQGARVVGRRSTNTGDTMDPDLDTDTDTLTGETAIDVLDDQTPAGDQVSHERSVPTPRQAPRPGVTTGGARVGARFRSFGHFALAAARGDVTGDELTRYQRALAQTTTAAQTGIVTEQWIREIIDLEASVTPTIEAFSSRPLPPDGDTVRQPRVNVRPTVARQDVQNTVISTTAVTITPVSFAVETFAGGQNMSLQTVMRSSPEYLDEVMRLYLVEMGESLNDDAVAKVVAGIPALQNALFTASFNRDVNRAAAAMFTALRQFPSFVILSVSKWQELADLQDTDQRPIYPSLSSMSNAMGTISIQTPTGQVRDLRFFIEPSLGAGRAIIAHEQAFRSFRGPIGTLTADVVATLGRDVAVYQFAASGVVDARGLYGVRPV